MSGRKTAKSKDKRPPPVAGGAAPSRPSGPSSMRLLLLCLALTVVAYLPVFDAGFVNWDDGGYTYENLAVRTFNVRGLLFDRVEGNHHPLTMLTLAFNFAISGDKAWSYHTLNLLLHLANVALVFLLALRLSEGRRTVALVTALFFGVHPMHVESVAWVSARKDTLYTIFFLPGLLAYLRFIERRRAAAYFAALGLCLLSLLCKPAAVIFPIALFTLDFLRKRKVNAMLFVEKIPFFVVAAAMGFVTLGAQKAEGAIDPSLAFPLISRILFAFYGLMMYAVKLFFPAGLAAFYPYPAINVPLPTVYFVSPLFSAALAVLCAWTWLRLRSRVVVFGAAFYAVNLLLVLQVVEVGSAVMADRYTYVPYIGLFFLLGHALDWWLSRTRRAVVRLSAAGATAILFTALAFRQAETWKNGAALWDQAIRVHPSSRAYVNRATLLRKEKNDVKALAYNSEALRLNREDHEAYANRGNIRFDRGENDLAMQDYNRALTIKPGYHTALDNRGALYSRLRKYDLALADFEKALAAKPDYAPTYKNRAVTFLEMKQYSRAIGDFEKYLELEPDQADIYNAIAVCYQGMGKYEESIAPVTKAIQLSDSPTFLLNRAISLLNAGHKAEAAADAEACRRRGAAIPTELLVALGLAKPRAGGAAGAQAP